MQCPCLESAKAGLCMLGTAVSGSLVHHSLLMKAKDSQQEDDCHLKYMMTKQT